MRRVSILLLVAIATVYNLSAQLSDDIRLNQVGFYTSSIKQAILVNSTATDFDIVSSDLSSIVFSGTLESTGTWASSGEAARLADFTSFVTPGEYVVSIAGVGVSHPFTISIDALKEPARAAWRYYYYNRASQAISEPYAEGFPRTLGHADDNVTIHATTGNSGTVNSPKGWYDAGDYGKYMMTANISAYTLLSTIEQFGETSLEMDLNIPESSNGLPDVIDELLWELDWMLTMQDPNDGGVYHKLTTTGFAGRVMPDGANGERFVCGKNTNVTLGFAATMAAAYRILEDYDTELNGRRTIFLAAAEDAWDWAIDNPAVDAGQCSGFSTGAYGDGNQDDEWAWAAADMYLATGDISYYNAQRTNIRDNGFGHSDWADARSLATISLLLNKDILTGNALADLSDIEANLSSLADDMANQAETAPYRVAMGYSNNSFVWGSNGAAGNQSFILLTAYNVFDDSKYLDAAVSNVDYILGRNGTEYCLFTGFGGKKALYPHHRISDADGIDAPIPGMVIGGPQAENNPDPCTFPSELEAKKFIDDWCSYSTNEVTVNWNAPFAFALTGLESIFSVKCAKPDLGDDINLCETEVSFPLTLSSGVDNSGTISWYKDDVLITGASNPDYTVISSADIGTYSFVRDSLGCLKTDDLIISRSLPFPDLGEDIGVPTGTTTDLETVFETEGYTHTWYRSGVEIANENTYQLVDVECGYSYVVLVEGDGCASRDTIYVGCDQVPFNGPHYFPGTVEAEDFDTPLTAGASYSDTEAENQGGYNYRPGEGVDIETTLESGASVGYIDADEYLEYTIEVLTSGTYDINFRVASGAFGGTGSFHFEQDGDDITGSVEVEYTDGWSSWVTETVSDVHLDKGTYIFIFKADETPFNLNWISADLTEADPVDTDDDGTVDALDECPTDPNKILTGDCGCFNEDIDANNNQISDCLETDCNSKNYSADYVSETLTEMCEKGTWTHFYNGNDIQFSIKLNGNQLDNLSVTLETDPNGIYTEQAVDDSEAIFVLDQSWDVSASGTDYDESTGNLTYPVSVRFYVDNLDNLTLSASDYAALNAHIVSSLKWFKSINGGALDIPSAVEPRGLVAGETIQLVDASMGTTAEGVTFVQLDDVTGFSGGSAFITTYSNVLSASSGLVSEFTKIDELTISTVVDGIKVSTNALSDKTLRLYSSNGQIMHVADFLSNQYIIPTAGLAGGIYYVQIVDNGILLTEKVIVP